MLIDLQHRHYESQTYFIAKCHSNITKRFTYGKLHETCQDNTPETDLGQPEWFPVTRLQLLGFLVAHGYTKCLWTSNFSATCSAIVCRHFCANVNKLLRYKMPIGLYSKMFFGADQIYQMNPNDRLTKYSYKMIISTKRKQVRRSSPTQVAPVPKQHCNIAIPRAHLPCGWSITSQQQRPVAKFLE